VVSDKKGSYFESGSWYLIFVRLSVRREVHTKWLISGQAPKINSVNNSDDISE